VSALELSGLIFTGAFAAGLLGSLTGLGGGVVIVPLLTIGFGVNIRYAIGASLVSVIATSSGAAAAYVREGYTNIRIAMLLEIATTLGAVAGAALAAVVSTQLLALTFAAVLLYSAYLSGRRATEHLPVEHSDPLAIRLKLNSSYPTSAGEQPYGVRHLPGGFALMGVAGMLSGLLGIGSGAVKVLAMDNVMHLPFKVSTTTSNLMIGVTAAASAGVYLRRGQIDPALAFPVMLGVLAGALVGTRLLTRLATRRLRTIFGVVVALLAAEMVFKALSGRI